VQTHLTQRASIELSNPSEQDLQRRLAAIHCVALLPPGLAQQLFEEARAAIEQTGLLVRPRAEGCAFFIPHLPLPHLRLALHHDRVLLWVRDPYGLTATRCQQANLSVEQAFNKFLSAAQAAALVFRRYIGRGTIHVELPET